MSALEGQSSSRRHGDREGNQDMFTRVKAKKVIGSAGDAAMRPQVPVHIDDGDGSAVDIGRGELIDLASAGVHPSTAKPVNQSGGL